MKMKKTKWKVIEEVRETFLVGDYEWIEEYVHRLKDLPECGLNFNLFENFLEDYKEAERNLQKVSSKFRSEAISLLDSALEKWSCKEVEVVLTKHK